MRLVDNGEEVCGTVFFACLRRQVGEIRKERMGRLPGRSTVEVARIILYTARVAKLADKRKIVKRTALQSLGFE